MLLAPSVRRVLGVAQTRGRDPDSEQAVLRIGISALVFIYAAILVITEDGLTHGLAVALALSGANTLVGVWMFWWLRTHTARPPAMRYLGLCSDLFSATLGMAGSDEAGVPLIGVYLWVTVGNGFRFGPRYLLASYWISLTGFLLLMLFVPFWQKHAGIGVSFGLILAVVPLYVLVLLSRLTAQKNEAEQLSNAKSRFVANVSHELRTPLTGVFAVHELLCARRMTPDDRELVGMLGSAIATLKQSVDAVLQMSKLEAGAERAEIRPFNLWYFLQQLAAATRPQATTKGVAWGLQVDADVPCSVMGDANHLSHALGNLINNAFKFTPAGSVSLRISYLHGGRIRFEVIDTGIGIPLEHQERLFERFVQVDISMRRRYGGTGLGMSIAHDLVKLMGGSIGVVSSPGQGSTFWIELPLPPIEPTATVPAFRGPRAILLIATAGPHRDECAATLQALGHDVAVHESTAQFAPAFDANTTRAAILLMNAPEAANYAEAVLRGRAGIACPWFVLAPGYSPTQYMALQRVGAAGLFSPSIGLHELGAQLAALDNRLAAPASPASPSLQAAGVVRPLAILLADDNASNRLLFSRILEDAGHAVKTAECGDTAFDLMAAGGIDLALLDLNMPDISGPDVVKLYRASSIGAEKLPIIILSADATPAAKSDSIEAGADDFLTKPITASGLLNAIERLVAGRTARILPFPGAPARSVAEAPATRTENPPGTLAASVVDPERIESLRSIAKGEQAFIEQYVMAACSELELAIADLQSVAASGDIGRARDALHIIIGTGASIGASTLVRLARNLGTAAANANGLERPGDLEEISTTYALTKSTLLAMIRTDVTRIDRQAPSRGTSGR